MILKCEENTDEIFNEHPAEHSNTILKYHYFPESKNKFEMVSLSLNKSMNSVKFQS